jgi:NitT/TauT family transport system substrate-binding protein
MLNAPRLTRRLAIRASIAGLVVFGSGVAAAQEIVRIGLPTKVYWPTVVAEAAVRQKLFEKEGLRAELTVYRGGAECFEALAAGATDVILDPPSLVATGLNKGIKSKLVAGGSTGYFGWHLMVPTGSKVTNPGDLNGKKVGITSAGSASDLLALWTQTEKKISFTRVPLGGGGLAPNLLSGNVDAVVLYSPLSFQLLKDKEARSLIDFASAVPENLNSGWIAADKLINEKPQVVQKTLNALFGGLQYLRQNREAAIKLIAEIDEIPDAIAAEEYEHTIMKLVTDGHMSLPLIEKSLEYARLGGMTDLALANETFTTQFKPVPTKP